MNFDFLPYYSTFDYICRIERAFVEEMGIVRISGDHVAGKTDADVTRVEIFDADMSHIPGEIFTAFPSLRSMWIMQGSLRRIPQLMMCENLEELSVSGLRVQVSATYQTTCKNH